MRGLLPDSSPFNDRIDRRLQQLADQGLYRHIRTSVPAGHGRLEENGRSYLNLAGNDYLGLADDRALLARFYDRLDPEKLFLFAPGSGASRLMTGTHPGYRELEESLASMYGSEKALVFNSGYHINIGLLPALAGKGDLILADKLCHASLIDGMRLSRARVIRYPHLDYTRIEELLKEHHGSSGTIFLVTESIFSMDGDCADLALLAGLKERYGAVLYVDEAHGTGVRGTTGLGLAEEQSVVDKIDLLIGTFGKAWAGQGAYVICSRRLHDLLVNQARSLIFTTALPPVSVQWLNFILPQIQKMEEKRKRLRSLGSCLRTGLHRLGLATGGSSQIVPVMIGDAGQTVDIAEQLCEHGFRVHGVRPPTVPPGTSRLRLSLTAAMDENMLELLPPLIAGAVQ
jgi:8-amino-7-oxononanoate synthase